MFDSGYWKIGSLRGVPIRFHWTLPLGALVFSGSAFAPAFWVAFIVLILLHEFGHAAVVRSFGHRALGVDVTGFGGLCRWSGNATAFERSAIAWGGVLAQSLLLLGTLVTVAFVGPPTHAYAAEITQAFIRTNLLLIGLNLLPFPPLDGAEAWKIFRHGRFRGLLAWWRDAWARTKAVPRRSSRKPAQVIDFQQAAQRKGARVKSEAVHDVRVSGASAKGVADELIRISKQAARARKKRDEN